MGTFSTFRKYVNMTFVFNVLTSHSHFIISTKLVFKLTKVLLLPIFASIK